MDRRERWRRNKEEVREQELEREKPKSNSNFSNLFTRPKVIKKYYKKCIYPETKISVTITIKANRSSRTACSSFWYLLFFLGLSTRLFLLSIMVNQNMWDREHSWEQSWNSSIIFELLVRAVPSYLLFCNQSKDSGRHSTTTGSPVRK